MKRRLARFTGLLFLASLFYALPNAQAELTPETNFTHEILMDSVSGLPASVEVHTTDAEVESIRLMLVLDGELIVVPLRRSTETDFAGSFPSPKKSIRYAFQFVRTTKGATLSRLFARKQTCAPETLVEPGVKGALLERATSLDDETKRLLFLTKVIEELKK